MRTYRVKKKVSHQGKIQLEALPFADGEVVEIFVFASEKQDFPILSSLKGSVLEYINPTEPVAQNDWIATQ